MEEKPKTTVTRDKNKITVRNKQTPIKHALVELLKVRSIVTLVIVGVTSYLATRQIIDAATYMTLAGAVITYYFNRKEQ